VEKEAKPMFEPFALEIYRRYQNGETVQQLAASLNIPADRIEKRIRAAATYLKLRSQCAA
jgi:hypothetical protein